MQTRWMRLGLLALVLVLAATAAQATPSEPALVQGGAPTVVSYQGQVQVGGSPYEGMGYFKFAITNEKGSTSFWSNDGTAGTNLEPKAPVRLEVTNGLFNVLLGDTSLTNMVEPLEAGVFAGTDRYLRVWFSTNTHTFTQLTPDRRIASVPYALQAAEVPGYAGVVVVAKSGGDFTQIQAAVDSISGASEENAYLVWVAPGLYEETVTLKPYVHLQGAGRKATILSSAVSSSADPPDRATVVLADETSLRDLTVKNEGTGAHNVAVLLTGTDKQAELANVYAETFSSGEVTAYAIYVRGTWAHLTATDVAAYGASGGDSYGLYSAANATLVGGQFRGRFGASAYGVHHVGSELVAEGATFEANDGAETIALYNEGWRARVHGGEVYAKGGGDTWGIYNANDGTLEVQDVTLYSEGSLLVASPSQYAYGLENNGATAILRGGKYHAYGGEAFTAGLRNVNSDAELEAYGVVAEGGAGPSYDNVYGLLNAGGASAVLRGGSYLAEGGRYTNGLKNSTVTSVIDAHGITAEARDGAIENHALDAGTSSTTDVRSSALVGDTALLLDNCTVHLAMTQLAGTISRTGGTLTCYGVYNASYAGIGCP